MVLLPIFLWGSLWTMEIMVTNGQHRIKSASNYYSTPKPLRISVLFPLHVSPKARAGATTTHPCEFEHISGRVEG